MCVTQTYQLATISNTILFNDNYNYYRAGGSDDSEGDGELCVVVVLLIMVLF